MYAQAAMLIDQPAWATDRAATWGIRVFAFSLVGSALAAYNLGPFPIPWFTQCAPVLFVACQVAGSQRLLRVPGLGLVSLFLVWAAAVTTVQAVVGEYSQHLPALMTAPYPVFLLLRFLAIASVAAQMYLTYWLLAQGRRDEVLRIVTVTGVAVAIAAIYIYVAQIAGLWEPPRTRIGTGGEEQTAIFTYAFHRAVGTFREPSHLAEWLLTPFFLSFLVPRVKHWLALPMALVILLTGSLTGILGGALGFLAAIALANPLSVRNVKTALSLLAVLAIGFFLFSSLAVAYSEGHTDLLRVIRDRVQPMIDGGGLAESNREDAQMYFHDVPIPVLGDGLGNANLKLSRHLGTPLVGSLLSLYYSVLYSTGYVGFALMSLFLLRPLVETWRGRATAGGSPRLLILAAYCSWLVTFSVHSEELTVMFGSVYAILCYEAGALLREKTPEAALECPCA